MNASNIQPLPRTFRSIQLLRSLACLLVVFFHCSMQLELYYHQSLLGGLFSAGYGGVDLFFVISGFVIAHSSTALWNHPAAFKDYWYKRVTRIYPIYWVILLPVALGLMTMGTFNVHAQSFPSLVAQWASMLVLWPGHRAIIGVSWTLSYEMYFYLLFSLLVLSSRFWVIPVGILVASLMVFTTGQQVGAEPSLTMFLLSPFNLEFAAGVLAWFLLKHVSLPLYTFLCMFLVALGIGFIYLPTVTNEDYAQRVLIFGTSSFLVVWALTGLESKRGMKIPVVLGHIGDASYMLYLIHFPVLVFANKLIPRFTHDSSWLVGLNIALVGIVFWVSVYVHWYVEKPLLHYLKRQPAIVSNPLAVVDIYK
jgi:exopolysaccharide production protein ExoZ